MDVADTNQQTQTKDRIHEIYLALARVKAHMVTWVTGDPYNDGYYIFMDFRRAMLELFELSRRYELSDELSTKMRKWSLKKFKTTKPDERDVWDAVDLYTELIDELVKLGKLDV